MIRRLVLAVALLLGVGLTATSCSTFEQNRVAEVGNAELTRDEFDSILTSKLGHTLMRMTASEGSVGGETARALVTQWVITEVAKMSAGAPLDTAAATEAAATEFGDDWANAPETLKSMWVEFQVINEMVQSGQFDREAFTERLGTEKVSVDPRIGTWDSVASKVVPVG